MSNTFNLDGHVWKDRGDGIYVPDTEYTIAKDAWVIPEDLKGKLFLLAESGVDGAFCVVAVALEWDSLPILWKYKDELVAQGREMWEFSDDTFECVGGLEYAVPDKG